MAGWITIISNQSGTLFLVNIMPDDDDCWTILKGSNVIEKDLVKNTDGTLNIKIGLDENIAKIFNFKSDLKLGESDTNAYFEGFQQSYGFLTIKREL